MNVLLLLNLEFLKNIPKSDDRIQLVGTMDELTSQIGMIRCRMALSETAALLKEIQNNLTESTVNKYGQTVETYPVETIEIPEHSLISVRSDQENANLKGAAMSSHTHKSGDESIQVNAEMEEYTERDYMYAFLSNSEMSAGLWSNSEHEGRSVYV